MVVSCGQILLKVEAAAKVLLRRVAPTQAPSSPSPSHRPDCSRGPQPWGKLELLLAVLAEGGLLTE